MNPSQPGYNFTTADLQRFNITPEDAARLLARETQGGAVPVNQLENPITALLAEMVRAQRRFNARYGSFGWSLAAWAKLQLLQQNPLRAYMLIQNVGSGDLMVLFESGPASAADLSSTGGQAQLTVEQTRAVRIVAGGNYEPLVAPSTEVTIFTLGTATQGVVVEGV